MDFLGLEKKGFFAHKLNRELSDDELTNELDRNVKASDSPRDNLNIIKINDSYLEIIDKWYVFKGLVTFAGCCFSIYLILMLSVLTYGTVKNNDPSAIWFLIFAVVIHLPIFYITIRLLSLELFQKTHYPIRFDYNKRKIFSLLPKGGYVETSWDDAFIFIKRARHPFSIHPSASYHYEICVHVLSSDRKLVKQTFSLGSFSEAKNDAINFWEFVRLYMEDSSSHNMLSRNVRHYLPIDTKAEEFRLSVVLTMAPISSYPLLQLITSPISCLFVLGRRLSIITSTVPKWPKDSLDNRVAKLSIRQNENTSLNFIDSTWPLICFIFGAVITTSLIIWGGLNVYYIL